MSCERQKYIRLLLRRMNRVLALKRVVPFRIVRPKQ